MKAESVLVVDVGNSRVKWGLGQSGHLTAGMSFSSRQAGIAGELDRNWGGLPAPSTAMISNVRGRELGETLHAWLKSQWGVAARFATVAASAHGVRNGYEDHASLGVDRWVALIAAHSLFAAPLCVADCGTALTVDAVDGQGCHRGGLIAPGLGLMRQSLQQAAPALHHVLGGHPRVPARDTADAVQGGILQMAAGLIERFLIRMEGEFGCTPRLVLTGGDAPSIARELNVAVELEPDLILRGLLLIAEGDS